MKFYDEIVHKLYVWNTNIEETEFEPFDFIEAKHNEAPFKGKVFYQNLIHAMPKHFGAKLRNDFFKEVLQYCQFKIDNIDKPEKTEFQFTYEQEVTEERKKALQKGLAKLKTPEEKISFLRDEKAKYLQNISARTLEVSGSVHANFAPNAELFFDRYIQIEIDKLESLKKNYKTEYSHREHILANKFKAKANIEKEKTANEWKAERGNNAYINYYTLNEGKNAKNYKEPTVKELTKVIELLKDYPEAQKIAINNKEKLERF